MQRLRDKSVFELISATNRQQAKSGAKRGRTRQYWGAPQTHPKFEKEMAIPAFAIIDTAVAAVAVAIASIAITDRHS